MATTILTLLALLGVAIVARTIRRRRVGETRSEPPALADAPVGLFAATWDGRITRANAELARLVGVASTDSLIGEDLGDRLSGTEDRTRWRRALDLRQRAELDVSLLRASEGALNAVIAIWPGTGDPDDGVVGCVRPIDVRTGELDRLESESALLREIIAAAPVGMMTMDADGRVGEVWNPAMEAILGWSPEEVRGRAVPLLPSLGVTGGMAAGVPPGTETTQVKRWGRDGRMLDLSVTTAPVVGLPGSGVVAVVQDISVRLREDAERRRLDEIVRATPDIVLMTDTETRILYANAAARHRLDLPSGKELETLHLGDLGVDRWERRWQEEVLPVLLTGGSWTGEVELGGGEPMIASVVIVGHRSSDGRLAFVSILGRDVTQQRSVEEQLRQSQKLEAVGQLTGGIAHDFNNLLTVVQANAEMLLEGAGPEMADILEAAQRGRDLVRQLMVFSRKEKLRLRPYPLIELGDYVRTLRRLLPETVTIDWECTDPDATMLGDPGAVQQILLNLATNARDAMPEGGQLRVAVGRGRPDTPMGEETVEIAASDTGVGMSAETVHRVFDPFFTTKEPGKGTGLGLAMVYGLVRQLEGDVSVESQPGVGTTFRLTFPRIAAPRPDEASVAARSAPEVEGPGGTVLVVEDEEAIRRVCERSLVRLGYRVLLAADGREGLSRFREHASEIDLVVSDVVMPNVGGAELLRSIRDEGHRVPFVFVSGYTEEETRKTVEFDDAVSTLPKPWTRAELAAVVRAALAGVAAESQ